MANAKTEMERPRTDAARWAAVENRDRSADGTFFYSVKTTGVYCKPSCAARPRRENVAFHEARADAERGGFRPCKRCRPDRATTEIAYAIGESSLGLTAIAATGKGVCAVLFGNNAHELRRDLEKRFPKAELREGGKGIAGVAAKVFSFIGSPRRKPAFALDMDGTEFQRKVWQALTEIKAGSTASYAEVARRIGQPSATRAVAQACAANPLAVAVPCHRVVRSDGSLSGYRWGPERKRALLAREVAT
jgi:AraC family transcriptional regulator, regulatory protein of adaptative response / methylated-DNA-[protein]-cysteine methyltransferase